MLSTTGAIQAQKVLPVAYVYYFVGFLSFIVAVFLLLALTDVSVAQKAKRTSEDLQLVASQEDGLLREEIEKQKQLRKRDKCLKLIKDFCYAVKVEKSILLACVSGASTMMALISVM